MTRQQTIQKLSADLAKILNKESELNTIEFFIQAAIVTETERLKGMINIYQKFDKKTGTMLGEYWGMDEIVNEFQTINEPRTIKRLINGAIKGQKRSAYGFLWKRI